MGNVLIYLPDEIEKRLQQEKNKSGLVRQLLENHFRIVDMDNQHRKKKHKGDKKECVKAKQGDFNPERMKPTLLQYIRM